MEPIKKTETAKFCGNILVRRTKRRSFLTKSLFEGVFGVLTDVSFEYYQSSAQWTKGEKPEVSIDVINIQSVEEVDDGVFGQALCFQITYHCRTKKDNSKTRTLYLSAYEVDEFDSWLCSLRSVCLDNPVGLAQYHPGRFTGKSWSCCKAVTYRSSPGCKPSTIYGIPEIKRHKLSPVIAFTGFGVVARESHYSDMPGSLPFNTGDHLTVSDASGIMEWKAFSTTSTNGYGYIPIELVKLKDLEEEPWFFDEIPTTITAAILRDQVPGCFILRTSGLGTRTILSFRTERTVKHMEVLLDETTQKYRVKDESDAVSYANFLQFDSIQQLLDQCKQHATVGITLEKYPALKNADEIWKVDWAEVDAKEETVSSLPWSVISGKFHNKDALIHVLPEGSSDILKERFSNQSRLMMTLNHDNIVRLHGVGSKGPRNFFVHENLSNGDLSEYLKRNSSLLVSHPSELGNILNHIINGMVYLHESSVQHGELVPKNCFVGDKGQVKISGFHCARSPWCKRPLSDEVYRNKVPIPAPELSHSTGEFPSDVWAFGLFIFTVVTVDAQSIGALEQVLDFKLANESLDHLGCFVDKIALCLKKDASARPTFQELRDQVSIKAGSSTPSCSSHSLEDLLNVHGLPEEAVTISPNKPKTKRTIKPTVDYFEDDDLAMDWDNSDVKASFTQEELKERLKHAELAALKAKALQKRAEAAKDSILSQVQEAEAKCLKEVEMITKTFLVRLNEANDRAAEAEQARYLAEEVKRLTDEKYTLYKYESEKNMHDLKSMLDDTILERDELMAALKTVGKDFEATEVITPKRRDSIRHLEDKYQRYISTSDRTIQSLKAQLNDVVKHRDHLASDREAIKKEMKDTRETLEQAVKEKEEFQFRLEEAQFEIERLEEMISTMTQKRQQAERERDQLQLLTDMSLMKLRQAESGAPKKRASVASMSPRMDEQPKDRHDPSLRRLSEQLLHLIGPSSIEKSPKSEENDSEKNAILEEEIPVGIQFEEMYEEPERRTTQRRTGEVVMPSVREVSGTKEIAATFQNGHAAEVMNSSSPRNQKGGREQMGVNTNPATSSHHKVKRDNSAIAVDQHGSDKKPFTIPTLHIEEADTDAEMGQPAAELPEIEISDVDENEVLFQQDEEDTDYLCNLESPMYIVEGKDGHTRIVYSFDDISELLEGIPQTSL